MKRDANSLRTQKWIQRNSLNYDKCREYVSKLCKIGFGINTFDIKPFDSNEDALWITFGLYSYIVEIDRENACLKVLERNSNEIRKDKYHILKKNFTNDSCWYNFLEWITKR